MAEPSACLCIAHRGASGHCPENTRAAFLRAIELGAHMVEVDCQLTRDGVPVILHDETLDRTTSGSGPLCDRTLREVEALDAGSWFSPAFAEERVPTLAATVEILRGHAALNLELKGDDDPGRLELECLGLLSSYRFLDQTVFSSFSPERMRAVREQSARARIGVLMDAGAPWSEGLRLASELGAEALHPERSLVRRDRVAEAHERGLEVRVWPVNRPSAIAALLAAGVDGIFTDYPERCLRLSRPRSS
ncbi:MAG: glycerophosphodiester phosphodiesterase [Candidatus Binatia bacterium]